MAGAAAAAAAAFREVSLRGRAGSRGVAPGWLYYSRQPRHPRWQARAGIDPAAGSCVLWAAAWRSGQLGQPERVAAEDVRFPLAVEAELPHAVDRIVGAHVERVIAPGDDVIVAHPLDQEA